ncbi:MAG: hypothetical protein AAFU79_30355 [Myxococcota bacterium]
MKRLALGALLTASLALAACGEDTGAQICTVDGDCMGGSCDQVTGSCFCTAAACAAMNLECLDNGTCGVPTMSTPDAGMMSMGCGTPGTQGDCLTGEICQMDGTCAPDTTDCGTAGIQGFVCNSGEVCLPSGACELRCTDDGATGCLAQQQLCDEEVSSTLFNQCVEAQSVTGGCANASIHMRQVGGPLLIGVDLVGNMGITSPNCTGDATVQRFRATVQLAETTDMLPGSLFTQGIKNLGPDGQLTGNNMEGLTFSDGVGPATHPSSSAVAGTTGRFEVDFTLCLSAAQMMQQLAIYINDDEGEASNAACFSAL